MSVRRWFRVRVLRRPGHTLRQPAIDQHRQVGATVADKHWSTHGRWPPDGWVSSAQPYRPIEFYRVMLDTYGGYLDYDVVQYRAELLRAHADRRAEHRRTA